MLVVDKATKSKQLGKYYCMLKKYHNAINGLAKYYEPSYFGFGLLPLPCYINFRDALCHYARLAKIDLYDEIICEGRALEEHLHRAAKDVSVDILQKLVYRISNVYNFDPDKLEFEEEVLSVVRSLQEQHKLGAFEIIAYINHEIELESEQRIAELKRSCIQYLYWDFCHKTENNKVGNRKILQEILHAIKNYDLESRDKSLRIEKPFSPDPSSDKNVSGIEQLTACLEAWKNKLDENGLLIFVLCSEYLCSHTS